VVVLTLNESGNAEPAVAVASDGEFVVVWRDWSTVSIVARRFSSTGEALGEKIQVVSNARDLFFPNVAIAPTPGRFVVAWNQQDPSEFFSANVVEYRLFDSSGNAVTSPQVISHYAPTKRPAIAMNQAGEFVIAWAGKDYLNNYPFDPREVDRVFAQRFDSDGSPLDRFSVSNELSSPSSEIDAAFAPDGGLSLLYNDDGLFSLNHNFYMANFQSDGMKQGIDAVPFPDPEFRPSLSIDSNGHRIVTWIAEGIVGNVQNFSKESSVSTPMNHSVSVFVSDDDANSQLGPITVSLPVDGTGIDLPIAPPFGTVSINQNGTPSDPSDDLLVYKPKNGFQGTEDIVYQLTNSAGFHTYGVLRVHVGEPEMSGSGNTASNPAFALFDSFSTKVDVVLKVGANGVLKNDGRVNHGKLTAELVSGPSHGTLTLKPNGSFVYQPSASFSGTDSFTYRVSNGQNFSRPATVTLHVNPRS